VSKFECPVFSNYLMPCSRRAENSFGKKSMHSMTQLLGSQRTLGRVSQLTKISPSIPKNPFSPSSSSVGNDKSFLSSIDTIARRRLTSLTTSSTLNFNCSCLDYLFSNWRGLALWWSSGRPPFKFGYTPMDVLGREVDVSSDKLLAYRTTAVTPEDLRLIIFHSSFEILLPLNPRH
jgi:hypothetical protein